MKQDERSKTVVLGVSTSTIRSLIGLILALVTTPIILKYLGDGNYGALKVLTEIFGNFSIFEFGIYSALINLFPQAMAEKNRLNEISIINMGIIYYLKSFLVMTLFASIVYLFLDQVIELNELNSGDLRLSYLTFMFTFLILPTQAFRAYLESHGKSHYINIGLITQNIITSTLSIVAAYLGFKIFGQVLSQVIGLFVFASVLCWKVSFTIKEILKSKYHDYRVSFKKISLASFISDLSGRICLSSDSIIISLYLGPGAVTSFYLTQRLLQIIQTQLQNLGGASWAALGQIYHSNDLELFNLRLLELTKIVSVLSVTLLIPLFHLNEGFINLWVGSNHFAGKQFNLIVILNSLFLPVLALWGWSFSSAGKVNLLTPMMVVQGIVNLSLSLYLTQTRGMVGPVLATLITYILVPIWWIPFLMRKLFKISVLKILYSFIFPVFIGVLIIILLQVLNFKFAVTNYFILMFYYTLLSVAIFFIEYLIVFNLNERRIIHERFIKVYKQLLKRFNL